MAVKGSTGVCLCLTLFLLTLVAGGITTVTGERVGKSKDGDMHQHSVPR